MTNELSPFEKFLKSRFWPAAWGAFGRAFVMLGLALLGWGVDDLAGFFAHPAHAGIAITASLVAILMGWLIYQTPPQPHQEHDPEHWHFSLMELSFILGAFGDRRNVLTWTENPSLRWAGLGLYLLAAFYFLWANFTWSRQLRRELGSTLPVPAMLTEGPYRWTRYPTLLGILLYTLGFALAFRSWVGLVFLLPLTWIILRRARLWDQTFAARHPQAWAARSQTSKRLIPFLY
jgi:protein-S-isoprenylcysteine O-methyltransferase Ste14